MISAPITLNKSVYNHVGDLITDIVFPFGLQSLHPQIKKTYQTIFEESLAFPLGTKPGGYSRINHDGTPIQFAVTLEKTPRRSFQFLGEAGRPGIAGIDRHIVNRNCIASVAQTMQLEPLLAEVMELINTMTPATHVDLINDPGGAFWIGAGFTASGTPQLKIYMNGAWGNLKDKWLRIGQFATYFKAFDYWQDLITPYKSELTPLGTAITLKKGAIPSGRIYLSAYGKRASYYEALSKQIGGESFQSVFQEFAQIVLAENYPYPTQMAVCSFGLGEGPGMDFKFELCGHCLFNSDAEAFSRIKSWLDVSSLASSDYQDVLGILSGGQPSRKATDLHCYIGVGQKQGSVYSTVYLKPKLYE